MSLLVNPSYRGLTAELSQKLLERSIALVEASIGLSGRPSLEVIFKTVRQGLHSIKDSDFSLGIPESDDKLQSFPIEAGF